jgi:cell wall-associated NlpC family hydrolase
VFNAVRRRILAVAVIALFTAILAGSVEPRPDVEPAAQPATATIVWPDDRAEALELQRASRAERARLQAAPPAAAPVTAPPVAVPATKPKKPTPARTQRVESTAPAPGSGAAAVVAYARAQVGKRYVFATAGPNTFDCSGLVKAAYARIGVSLPHQTGGLARRGRSVSRAQLQPGDLVFPTSGHVGVYVGGGKMVHASTPRGGVKLSSIYKFSFARRIL